MSSIKIVLNKKLSSFAILLSVIILSTIIGLSMHLAFAWTGPSANPPNPNAAAPITASGGTISGNLTVTGTLSGSEGFIVDYPGSGVYDNSTSDAPYSRINADSFHTNGLGVGQMWIEGYAIDANGTIKIGKGLAGGQGTRSTEIGDDLLIEGKDIYFGSWSGAIIHGETSYMQAFLNRSDNGSYEWFGWYSGDPATGGSRAGIFLWDGSWNGCDEDRFCIFGDSHQLMLKTLTSTAGHTSVLVDDDLEVTGTIRLGNYATKPTCNASNLGAMVFDTANDKPYVCVSTGWKDLDRDTAAEWKPTNFQSPNVACANASMKPIKTSDGRCILWYADIDGDICNSDFGGGVNDGICVYMTNSGTGQTGHDCANSSTGKAQVLCTPL